MFRYADNVLRHLTRVTLRWIRGEWILSMATGAGIALGIATGLGTARAENGTNVTPASPEISLDPTYKVGSWIWAKEAFDKQTCRFWRAFDVPNAAAVTLARLCITGDNAYTLFLDGREVGQGSDWRSLTEYDLTWVLAPGRHVLAVEAFNDRLQGGLLLGFQVDLSDGRTIVIASDDSWRVVPEGESGWKRRLQAPESWPQATVVGAFGSPPWDTKPYATTMVPALQPISRRFWESGWFQISLACVSVVVILISLRLAAQLAVQSKAQRLLQRERARIARDIHDDLGAGLTQLVLLGEVMQSELPSESDVRGQIDQLCERARGLCGQMDEVVWTVNSKRDTVRDFASYVCKYALTFFNASPIRCRLDVEVGMPAIALDLPVRRNLFLAVKEALNNAAKYSEAAEVHLRIHRRGSALVVTVEDDGRGFAPDSAFSNGNGLTNMAERLAEIGGTCLIESQPDQGCIVEFRIPLSGARREPFRWAKSSGGNAGRAPRIRVQSLHPVASSSGNDAGPNETS